MDFNNFNGLLNSAFNSIYISDKSFTGFFNGNRTFIQILNAFSLPLDGNYYINIVNYEKSSNALTILDNLGNIIVREKHEKNILINYNNNLVNYSVQSTKEYNVTIIIK
jgi:hypothetical protein